MLDLGGKNNTYILPPIYFPPFQMHICWVIPFLPEKVKKRHSHGEETAVKFHSLHDCICFQPVAINTADRSLLDQVSSAEGKSTEPKENYFKKQKKQAFQEKHLMKGNYWMYCPRTMKNTPVKTLKRSRTFQQHLYGPVWQQTITWLIF